MRYPILILTLGMISLCAFAYTQATNPSASRIKPVLPSKITSDWNLLEFNDSDNPIPFIKLKGYYAVYAKQYVATLTSEVSTHTLRIDILQVENASDAEKIYLELYNAYQLPDTNETLSIAGLKKLVFKEGTQDSPQASLNAQATRVKCAIAWFPPFIVLFQIQNGLFGIEEVKTILKSLAWRE